MFMRCQYGRALVVIPIVLCLVAISLLLLAEGFLTRLSDTTVVVLTLGALVAVVLSLRPVLLLWFVTLITLVVAGSIRFFLPQLGQVWWVAYGAAFLLFVPALLGARVPASSAEPKSVLLGVSTIVLLIDMVAASALALSPGQQIIFASKSLFMFGGVWALFALMPLSSDTVKSWLKGLLFIGLIQWAPAFYQYLVVRTSRQARGLGDISAADSVVGTFGGSMEAGGLTAVLAFFLAGSILVLTGLHRAGALSGRRLMLLIAVLGVPLLLMEVKVVFIYLPIGLAVIFRRDLLRRPVKTLLWGSVVCGLLAGGIAAYQYLHWSVRGTTIEESVEKSFSYSFSRSTETGALTRRGVIEFWWDKHGMDNLSETIIGHGLGAARTQGQTLGTMAVKYYPAKIDRTGVAMFLWDFGILGTAAFFCMLFGTFLRAGRIAKTVAVTWQAGLAAGLQAVCVLAGLSSLYRNDIPYAAPMMFLLMGLFGLTAWLGKQENRGATR